jgi:2-phospho-L-lactate guanylyltransferase
MQVGLLPVKSFRAAKQRLTGYLDEEARSGLARALFEDALMLCSQTSIEWWLVSDEPEALERAGAAGLKTLGDRGAGLNAALVDGLEEVARAGATGVTILPSDVPLARASDVEDLLDTGDLSDIVVVPSERDGGTNALHITLPTTFRPRFGSSSLRAHIDAAEQDALRCSILALPRLALDIDTREDIEKFLAGGRGSGTATAAYLERLSLPAGS